MDEHEGEVLAEGERLQKIMARAGIGSRRRCEELISEGRVKVNGVVVRELGSRARAGDTVEVDGVNIGAGERIVHYAVYKPVGYVSTASDPEGRPKVVDLVPSTLRLYPVGRLDYDTEGLIIVTNDGHLTNVLTHPSHEINKTYLALVQGTPDELAIGKLRHGVELEDGMTAPARVRIIKPEGADAWVELTIHEGRNRQVRRMCETVGHPVLKLIRTRIGRLNLAGLQPGKFRALSAEEVATLEEQADPEHANAESESADWALAESRGEKRPGASPAKEPKRVAAKKSAAAKPATKKPAAKRPAAKKPGVKTAAATKPAVAKPAAKKPVARKSVGLKTSPVKAASDKAPAGRPVRAGRPQRALTESRPKTGPTKRTGFAGRDWSARQDGTARRERPSRGEGPARRGGSAPRKSAVGLPSPAKRGSGATSARGRGPGTAGPRRGQGRNDAGKGERRNGSH